MNALKGEPAKCVLAFRIIFLVTRFPQGSVQKATPASSEETFWMLFCGRERE